MKKYWLYIIAAVIVIAVAAFVLRPKLFRNVGSDSAQREFTVGFDANFRPYGYMENGEYCGFDLDLAREVAVRNNWKLVLKPINWDAKDVELNSGMIDCIWNGFTINGREHAYTWSDPYVANEQVVLVPVGSAIQKLDDLRDKVVAVQTDTPVQKALSNGGKKFDTIGALLKGLVVTPDYPTAVMMMEAGSVDAVAMDEGVAAGEMEKAPGKFRVLSEAVMPEYYGIGFRKGDIELRDAVQNRLMEMVKDGVAAKISAKYFNGENRMIIGTVDLNIPENSAAAKVDVCDIAWQLGKGLLVSITIFLLTLIFSLPLGMVVAWGRMSGDIIIRNIFKIYISVMRGTPLMLQLLVWYFGPFYIFGIQLSKLSFLGIDYRFIAVIIGFALNYAAYFAEIYRAGIESVPRGQYEAADVLGYTRVQRFFRIILPQVIKRILPPVTNEVITLVKDTSLAFSLSVLEMFTIARQIGSASSTMIPFVVAGIFYYICNFIVAFSMAKIEKKLNYYR